MLLPMNSVFPADLKLVSSEQELSDWKDHWVRVEEKNNWLRLSFNFACDFFLYLSVYVSIVVWYRK